VIYVHCKAPSTGAQLLAEHLREAELPARRTRDVEKLHKWIKPNDLIIGWGEFIPFAGVRVLNGKPVANKLFELEKLAEGGIPVPPFDTFNWGEGWLGRSLHHQEGGDFLTPGLRAKPSFWTRKLDIVEEFRFHIFGYADGTFKSIRAGKKEPRIPNPHPWVRSWDAGWKISYGETIKCKNGREVAKAALAAVGYDFGAVDIGVLKGGEVVVLEVNSRPGLEENGGTVLKYVEAVKGVVGNG
jgi:hypothetical protein